MEILEKQKFIAAYEAYADAIFRFCLFRTYTREQAMDMTQETFTRVWNYLVKGNKIQNVRAFLYQTARNIIVDESRKHKEIPLSYEEKDEPEIPPAQHKEIEKGEVLETIKNLDHTYRDVVLMRYIDGFSPKEIARILEMTENVVSVRIHRGVQQLKKFLNR